MKEPSHIVTEMKKDINPFSLLLTSSTSRGTDARQLVSSASKKDNLTSWLSIKQNVSKIISEFSPVAFIKSMPSLRTADTVTSSMKNNENVDSLGAESLHVTPGKEKSQSACSTNNNISESQSKRENESGRDEFTEEAQTPKEISTKQFQSQFVEEDQIDNKNILRELKSSNNEMIKKIVPHLHKWELLNKIERQFSREQYLENKHDSINANSEDLRSFSLPMQSSDKKILGIKSSLPSKLPVKLSTGRNLLAFPEQQLLTDRKERESKSIKTDTASKLERSSLKVDNSSAPLSKLSIKQSSRQNYVPYLGQQLAPGEEQSGSLTKTEKLTLTGERDRFNLRRYNSPEVQGLLARNTSGTRSRDEKDYRKSLKESSGSSLEPTKLTQVISQASESKEVILRQDPRVWDVSQNKKTSLVEVSVRRKKVSEESLMNLINSRTKLNERRRISFSNETDAVESRTQDGEGIDSHLVSSFESSRKPEAAFKRSRIPIMKNRVVARPGLGDESKTPACLLSAPFLSAQSRRVSFQGKVSSYSPMQKPKPTCIDKETEFPFDKALEMFANKYSSTGSLHQSTGCQYTPPDFHYDQLCCVSKCPEENIENNLTLVRSKVSLSSLVLKFTHKCPLCTEEPGVRRVDLSFCGRNLNIVTTCVDREQVQVRKVSMDLDSVKNMNLEEDKSVVCRSPGPSVRLCNNSQVMMRTRDEKMKLMASIKNEEDESPTLFVYGNCETEI